MAITGTNILDQLLDEVQGLGRKFTGTATNGGATVTTTDPEINKLGTLQPSTRFQGRFLYIPTGTVGTDDVHSIQTSSVSSATATLTTNGNYAATYTSVNMYILAIHPNDLRRLVNDALELDLTNITLPLTYGTDWDMQTSGVTNWTDTNATSSKVTAVANVIYGVRGLRVLNSSSNGYSQSASTRITKNQPFVAWAIGRADVGTATATLVDGSGNTLTSLTSTEEQWVYMWDDVTPGSTAEEVSWRLGGSGASDDTYWAAVGIYKPDEAQIFLPSWVDEPFKLKALSRACFRGPTDDSRSWQAMSREMRKLNEGADYRVEIEHGSLNPAYVEIVDPGWRNWDSPYFITGMRPYSDFGTLGADTDSVYAPLHVVIPRAKYLLGDRYSQAFPDVKMQAMSELAVRAASRRTETPKPTYRVNRMFLG